MDFPGEGRAAEDDIATASQQRKTSLRSTGDSPASSTFRKSISENVGERKPSARKLSILSDAAHERRPSDVIEARKPSLAGTGGSGVLSVEPATSSTVSSTDDDDALTKSSAVATTTAASAAAAAKAADAGEEMLAIPEDSELAVLPTLTGTTARTEGVTPPLVSRASRDEFGSGTQLRASSTMAQTGNKIREGLLASIRGFRKAVKDAMYATASDDDGSPTPKATEGGALVSFNPVEPVRAPATSDGSSLLASDEETVGKSELYGAFFRMLRMGVPAGAVKSKMASKGLNGAVIDLGEDGLMSRAHALEVAYEQELKRKREGATMGEKLHWEPVPLPANKETVFTPDANGVALSSEVLAQVDAVFVVGLVKKDAITTIQEEDDTGKRGTAAKRTLGRATTAVVVQTALDPRRAQGINIMTKKLKLTPGALCTALQNLEESVLTPSAVEVLLATVVWPASDEEVKALQALADRKVDLQGADALVWLVHQLVPDAEARLRALAFRYEFDSTLAEVVKAVGSVKQAAKEVVASARLQQIVQVVLQLGNKVNQGSGVVAQGFTLASLHKLAMTKSVNDKSVTMLDFLAKTLESAVPDALKVLDDLPTLAAARKVELQQQLRLIRDSRRALEGLRKVKQLEVFAFTSMQSLDSVESQSGVARDFFDRACAYFCIEVGAMDSHEFFETLWTFLDALTTIADKARAQALKQAKDAQRKANEAQEKAEIDAQLNAAGGKKMRKSILQTVMGGMRGGGGGGGGPPKPPVPTFGREGLRATGVALGKSKGAQ